MQNQAVEIQKWINARQDLLVSFNQLCQFRPFTTSASHELHPTLESFCQVLVDYLAYGSFKAFEFTVPAKASAMQDQLLGALNQLMSRFLDFNDKYQKPSQHTELERDLSALALDLAMRFDWEDQLIKLAMAESFATPTTEKSA